MAPRYYTWGGLFWTTELTVPSVEEAISHSYPNQITFLARTVNHRLNDFDEKLSEAYGLSYELLRIHPDFSEILRYEDGLESWERCGDLKTIQDFVEAHDQLIIEVGEYYSKFSTST